MYNASHVRPTYQFFLSYGYRLLSYELLNLITFPLTGSHCACAVSRDLSPGRGQNDPHFEIPDPNLSIHFVTFKALRKRLSHVVGQK